MSELFVNAPTGRSEIRVGPGLLDACGEACAALGARAALLVSDPRVFALYGSRALDALKKAGCRAQTLLLPQGEAAKSWGSLLALWEAMAEAGLSRKDAVVALGGGAVGDVTGFAAATYLRGVRLVQLPTTLLAQVDSSVGGKNAVNLPQGKNLAGTFYQPQAVLCDIQTLETLEEQDFLAGAAEVIKYGLISDDALFASLEQKPDRAALQADAQAIVTRCLEIKRDFVERDERDQGARAALNFGHTIAHALEAASGYTVGHGRAVAAGMAWTARFGNGLGITPKEAVSRVEELLRRMDLPVDIGDGQGVSAYLSRDKKAAHGSVREVLLTRIGAHELRDVPLEAMKATLVGIGGA